MLEKAMISGVVHQREETVYRVEGVTRARLFGALAEAHVNVDTIVQTGAEIVFSAPPEDRDGRRARARRARRSRGRRRDDLGKVSLVGAGMKSHPGVAAKTFATLEAAGIEPPIVSTSPIKIACHVPTDDVDRAVQALHEAFEPWPLTPRIGVVGATGAVGTITLELLRERGYRDVRALRLGALGRARARRDARRGGDARGARRRRPRPLPLLGRHVREPRARPARRARRGDLRSTSRRPSGSSPASRSSCPR